MRSPKRLIVLLEPKSGGAPPKTIFTALRAGPPTFKFVTAPLNRNSNNNNKDICKAL